MLDYYETDMAAFIERGVKPVTCVQTAGDVLLIPESWGHGVLNIQVKIDCAVLGLFLFAIFGVDVDGSPGVNINIPHSVLCAIWLQFCNIFYVSYPQESVAMATEAKNPLFRLAPGTKLFRKHPAAAPKFRPALKGEVV